MSSVHPLPFGSHAGALPLAIGQRRTCLRLGLALIVAVATGCAPSADGPSDKPTAASSAITPDHVVRATPENVSWGWFPIDKPPVLTMRSGEVVEISVLTGFGAAGDEHPVPNLAWVGIDSSEVPHELGAFWETHATRPREGRNGHLITGPVYVEGAEPGDVLEVQILSVRPWVPWGVNFTRPRSGVLSESYPGYREGDPALDIPLETETQDGEEYHIIRTVTVAGVQYGEWKSGIRVPLAPFMGILAVAPDLGGESYGVDVPGVRRSGPPGRFGGNLDVKQLTSGTTLYLPVFHPGALFYVGDPHGGQGDGEVSGTAIEQSMIGTFRLVLHKGVTITGPRGETPTHHLILGLDLDLDRALRNATYEVVQFLVATYGLRPSQAFSIASVAVDFRVSEAVDGIQLVTGMVPKSLFADSLRGAARKLRQ